MSTAQVARIGLPDTSQTCISGSTASVNSCFTQACTLKPARGLVPPGGSYGALHGLNSRPRNRKENYFRGLPRKKPLKAPEMLGWKEVWPAPSNLQEGREGRTLEGAVLTPLFPSELPDSRGGHLTTRPQLHTELHLGPQGPCSFQEPRRGVLLASDVVWGQGSQRLLLQGGYCCHLVQSSWILGPGPCLNSRVGAGGISLLCPERPYPMKCLGFRLL